MKYHTLNTWPEFYEKIVSGEKTFESRKNDRGFQQGDVVTLREYDINEDEHSGRSCTFKIGFVLTSGFGLKEGYCAFSLIPFKTDTARIIANIASLAGD